MHENDEAACCAVRSQFHFSALVYAMAGVVAGLTLSHFGARNSNVVILLEVVLTVLVGGWARLRFDKASYDLRLMVATEVARGNAFQSRLFPMHKIDDNSCA